VPAEPHTVPADDPGAFQPSEPRRDRRARDAQSAREHRHALAGIELQRGNQLAIYGIQGKRVAVGQGGGSIGKSVRRIRPFIDARLKAMLPRAILQVFQPLLLGVALVEWKV
jgi:hypothetical protein